MRSAPALASAVLLALLTLASAASCPGSQACCGLQGIVSPTKLCNSKKDGTGEIMRGPCAAQPYDTVEYKPYVRGA
ncbi:hypothetical protein VC83_08463 [Pseudogymnoascus destructans]|uniref:Hydrophobin n=1 Tax=Pseudogymnoascus destructans TaxID=655981 RepID=A0A176ZYP3_9PEZI|nr:uncharacterized protein VC83_08463 [Pseudogymnoascus destructans]OAF55139.1 hypothetical protein VC83_08463 [Pseudogymnoascus destructans]